MDEKLKLSGNGDTFLFPRSPCGEPKGESAASAARGSPANCLFHSFLGVRYKTGTHRSEIFSHSIVQAVAETERLCVRVCMCPRLPCGEPSCDSAASGSPASCGAVCRCSVLQCGAVRCSVLQRAAVCCSALWCVAVRCCSAASLRVTV